MTKTIFKNTGKLKKDFVKKQRHEQAIKQSNKIPIGIKLPLTPKKNRNQTLFEMTYSLSDQVKVNLKNLILTKKGECLCNYDFGTNLIDLYNQTNLEEIEDFAMQEIQSAVNKYMPFVSLQNYTSIKIEETFENPEYYEIKIDYNIPNLNENSKLIIKLLTSR